MPSQLNRVQLQQLHKNQLIDLIESLYAQVDSLSGQIQYLQQAVKRLENQLAKNSTNSSLPPSSDGLKTPRTRSLRKKQGRKRGGQKGHPGHTLLMSDTPDEIQSHRLSICPNCQTNLSEVVDEGYQRRQVFDVPPVRLQITEHQAEIKHCPHCLKTVVAPFPPSVSQPVQYGERLLAQASYLNSYHLIPIARTTELFGDLYGQQPADALVSAANEAVSVGAADSLEAIKEQLREADVVHFDESGITIDGKTQWLHVAGTEQLTYFYVHQKRGQQAMSQMGILPHFTGRAVHDHWSSYQTFDNCCHAYCNAHHLRELQFITDQYQQPWAEQMSQLLLDMKGQVEKAAQHTSALEANRIAEFETRFDAIIKAGQIANPPNMTHCPKRRGRRKQSPPKNLLDRLDKHKAEVLAFMTDFNVPFDNNLAERDIRMVKVKQKISGGFRTETGAKTFCAIRSYISTVKKNGRNVIDSIAGALSGNPFIPAPDAPPE